MRASRKPRCFVAMAFDHDDTDALYEGAILPVLRANGIVPVIINRREDNRDINHQIIDQLNACDFCIADLTYARPSVYFEAGYAQRTVEVIYTVRLDHLEKNQPDDHRVHFDLQMKPLIKWTKPDDRSFPKRLERRIRSTVLRRWNKSQKKKEKERQQREDFAHMPISTRIAKLRVGAVSTISKLGFSKWTPLVRPYSREDSIASPKGLAQLATFDWIMVERREKRLLHIASVRIEESLTLKKLRNEFGYRFISSSYPLHLDGHKMVDERSPVNRIIEHHILGSIRPVPRSRIMSAIPSLSWDSANSRYGIETIWRYSGSRWRTKGKKRDWVDVQLSASRMIYVHFIDGIQSLPEFRSRLRSIAEQIDGNLQRPAQQRG